jgi:hypothetical protein
LKDCFRISDISALRNVRKLDISGCSEISDVSGLMAVETLHVTSCNKIKDISMLRTLKELKMLDCPNIHSLINQVNLRSLQMDGTTTFQLPISSTLRKLSFYWVNQQETPDFMNSINLHSLEGIRELLFNYCILPIESLLVQNLQSLTINNCDKLTSIPLLPTSLGFLEISNCRHLGPSLILKSEMSGNTQFPLYEVKIGQCPRVKIISIHPKISQCTITNCYNFLQSVEVFHQIDLLKINQCYLKRILLKDSVVCIKIMELSKTLWTKYDNKRDTEITRDDGGWQVNDLRKKETHEIF